MMPLQDALDELGQEIFGVQWLAFRPYVAAWVERNPDKAEAITRRLRQRVMEGRL